MEYPDAASWSICVLSVKAFEILLTIYGHGNC